MYVGNYQQLIDSKGRIILPVAFRQAFSKSFTISTGFDQCLNLWREEDWRAFASAELEKRSDLSAEARKFKRTFYSSAQELILDSQHRFLIPQGMRKDLRLEREIIFVGAGSHVELWPLNEWKKYIAIASSSLEDISESLSRQYPI